MAHRRRAQKKSFTPADHLDFLLSVLYDRMALQAEHLDDLRRSALTDETIAMQKIRTVPPHMIERLLGYTPPRIVRHAYVIPYADPRGGFMPHVRMKIFPSVERKSSTIRYLQPRRSGIRIFFPLAAVEAVLHSAEDLYLVEGEKKALCVAQTGVPVIGIAGVEGWHAADSERLHPDLDDVGLEDRVVHLWPDDDVSRNPMVAYAMDRLGLALKARGVRAMTIVRPELA
jgi:hypothetical protein